MSHGRVKDDGDEGLRGQRIGWLKEIDHETGEEEEDSQKWYFNNGHLGSPPNYRKKDLVDYDKRGGYTAIVNRYIGT